MRPILALAAVLTLVGPSFAQTTDAGKLRALLERYAPGWDGGVVVREDEMSPGSSPAKADASDWLVYEFDGDIRIFSRRDLRIDVRLPASINGREREFDPSLVRTHDGRFALLWARGASATRARRFVSFSDDLLRWATPERLVFDDPALDLGYTYGLAEPLERTYNVVPVQSGYAMLLAQGFLRFSDDLKHWGAPLKLLRQDLWRNRVINAGDGTTWAVFETSSDERQPYMPEDWLHGFVVIGDKQYRHSTELVVSRSVDGRAWQHMALVILPGQPSGLWLFTTSDHRLGIAAGFNNLYVRWFVASTLGQFTEVEADLKLFNQTDQAEFSLRDDALTCVRPFRDSKNKLMLLAATSKRQF
jgi:hypothetical protein